MLFLLGQFTSDNTLCIQFISYFILHIDLNKPNLIFFFIISTNSSNLLFKYTHIYIYIIYIYAFHFPPIFFVFIFDNYSTFKRYTYDDQIKQVYQIVYKVIKCK